MGPLDFLLVQKVLAGNVHSCTGLSRPLVMRPMTADCAPNHDEASFIVDIPLAKPSSASAPLRKGCTTGLLFAVCLWILNACATGPDANGRLLHIVRPAAAPQTLQRLSSPHKFARRATPVRQRSGLVPFAAQDRAVEGSGTEIPAARPPTSSVCSFDSEGRVPFEGVRSLNCVRVWGLIELP